MGLNQPRDRPLRQDWPMVLAQVVSTSALHGACLGVSTLPPMVITKVAITFALYSAHSLGE